MPILLVILHATLLYLVVCAALWISRRRAHLPEAGTSARLPSFPKGFLFGVATSAFQLDGGGGCRIGTTSPRAVATARGVRLDIGSASSRISTCSTSWERMPTASCSTGRAFSRSRAAGTRTNGAVSRPHLPSYPCAERPRLQASLHPDADAGEEAHLRWARVVSCAAVSCKRVRGLQPVPTVLRDEAPHAPAQCVPNQAHMLDFPIPRHRHVPTFSGYGGGRTKVAKPDDQRCALQDACTQDHHGVFVRRPPSTSAIADPLGGGEGRHRAHDSRCCRASRPIQRSREQCRSGDDPRPA